MFDGRWPHALMYWAVAHLMPRREALALQCLRLGQSEQ